MSNDVIAAQMGMGGLLKANEALQATKSAATIEDKVAKLTHTVEVLIGHLQHLETQKRMAETNAAMGNV